MKRKHNEGSSLIEVLVGIVVLALIVVPTCTSLVMSARINAKAEQLLQDQLAVSSAVETLMANGITKNSLTTEQTYSFDRDDVTIKPYDPKDIDEDNMPVILNVTSCEAAGYRVKISKGEVSVDTFIKFGGVGA